jgi:hypothetical protein
MAESALETLQFLALLFQFIVKYNPFVWALLCGYAFVASYFGGKTGKIVGHVLMLPITVYLDLAFLEEIARTDPSRLDGHDFDGPYYVGIIIRTMFVNAVLLPISNLALRKRAAQ